MISIEVIVPRLKKSFFITTKENAKISTIESKLSELIRNSGNMFLVDSENMNMLDSNMTVEEAKLKDADRLLYICSD